MNFRGIPGAGNFHGRRGVPGRQDILMDSHLMGQEAFHEPRQGVSSMFPEPIPPEMDYRTVHRVLDCLSHYSVSSVCFDREELLWTGTHRVSNDLLVADSDKSNMFYLFLTTFIIDIILDY